MRGGVLENIVVLDFSTLLPGPLASLFLAEAGATVIKVERPGTGEEMRSYVPRWEGDSANFHILNRGKKSITVDLKNPAALRRLKPLIARADILIEQFRPGTMARLGLGYDAVSAINPRLIYCSISGYGQTGPKRNVAGHDLNYIADNGLLALGMGDGERTVVPPALVADIGGGTYPAVVNILLALRERDRSGKGGYLDIAMAESVYPFLYWAIGEGQACGEWPGNGASLVTGGSCRYRLYQTGDGGQLSVAAIEPKFWAMFTDAIGLDVRLRDDTVDPVATRRAVAGIIGSKPSAHWALLFAQVDCCCAIVRPLKEAMADPHFAARGVFSERLRGRDGGDLGAALPMPLAPYLRARPGDPIAAPRLGEHDRLDPEDLLS